MTLIESAPHVLPREAAQLGEALGEALRRDGIELILGVADHGVRKDGADYVLQQAMAANFVAIACLWRRAGVLGLPTSVWKPLMPKRTVMEYRSIRT